MNSYKFMPMDRLQAYRVLPLFVLGAVWAWWMHLGRDLHWMMNFTPSNPSKATKNMSFSSKNLKIRVTLREFQSPIQTATYPPFMKGTKSTVQKIYELHALDMELAWS